MTTDAMRRAPGQTRLVIPDVLRGIAIVAMLIAHAAPFVPQVPGALRFIVGNINDLASPLFAMVMGMSAQLVWQQRRGVPVTLLQQGIRGLLLIALGVWMATWGSWVAIVLAHLGILLIVGVPLLLLRTPWVAAITALVWLASDPLNAWARSQPWAYDAMSPWRDLWAWTVLGSSYRLSNLLPFFLLGALLLRRGLRRDAITWSMLAVAPVAYLARPVAERVSGLPGSISGDYLDTLHDIGLVFATYAIVVLAASARSGGVQRAVTAVFTPFRAWGRIALSLYVLHVGLIAWWLTNVGYPVQNDYLPWMLVLPGVLVIGWLWVRWIGTGPVEWVMGLLTGRPKRLRAH